LLWYYLCYRKGIDARGIPLWLGLGIAFGGELGYGQCVSWIQGESEVGDADQYAGPLARMVLFAPAAVLILGVTAYKIGRIMWLTRRYNWRGFEAPHLPERVADLMAVISAVGTATIWPSKIGVLYAIFLCIALFALHRLNSYFDYVDSRPGRAQRPVSSNWEHRTPQPVKEPF